MSGDEEPEAFMNLVNNLATPIDLRNSEVVFGAAEYVFFEVFTSWMIRYLFKFEKRTIFELAAVHSISLPMIGGASAFMDDTHALGYEAPWGSVIQDGAKGVPAVFAAQYLVQTAMGGFHTPKVGFKEVLITVASKVLTRVLLSGVWNADILPVALRNNLDILEAAFSKQHSKSRFKSDDSS